MNRILGALAAITALAVIAAALLTLPTIPTWCAVGLVAAAVFTFGVGVFAAIDR